MIRRATLHDFDVCYSIARRMYPDRPVHLGIPWFLDCLKRQDRLVLVSDHGFGVASLCWKYGFQPVVVMDLLAIDKSAPGMSAVRFLRAMIQWAKASGAQRFTVGSDTGVDFGPLVRRIGGRKNEMPSYHVML